MITYYTDGSASPNPGPGGFAVIRDNKPYIIGGEPSDETTNIRMEGMAIKSALEDANGQECQIFTDSEFWINVITKWAAGWQSNGWKKKGGEIKNIDIVQAVYALYQNSHATLTWVRGHEGDEGNEMADEWANIARERRLMGPERVSIEDAPNEPIQIAAVHFAAGRVMQLATMHTDRPRVNSVYYVATDDCKSVYWMSEAERRHSLDIIRNPQVSGAIVIKQDQPVMGLQFSGTASEVTDLDEIERFAKLYGQKYGGMGADLHERVRAGTNKHHLYKLAITELELFDEVNFPGGEVIPVPLS